VPEPLLSLRIPGLRNYCIDPFDRTQYTSSSRSTSKLIAESRFPRPKSFAKFSRVTSIHLRTSQRGHSLSASEYLTWNSFIYGITFFKLQALFPLAATSIVFLPVRSSQFPFGLPRSHPRTRPCPHFLDQAIRSGFRSFSQVS